MVTKWFALIGLIATLSIPSCSGGRLFTQRETMLESSWGRSFESAKHNQILNHEAGKNLDPVVGLDGQIAEATIGKYRKDFTKPPSENVYNLHLGSIAGIGQR